MSTREARVVDNLDQRNVIRLVHDRRGVDTVYFEVRGNHDGTQVYTRVAVYRTDLIAALYQTGVLP